MNKLKRVLRSSIFWGVGLAASFFIAGVLFAFTNLEITKNNFGSLLFYYEIITSIITILLTGIVFGLTAYKACYFSQSKKTTKIPKSFFHGFLSTFGTFLSVLVTGCPACSITLATYIGISGFFAFLPFFGYELRVLGILVTLFAIWLIWKNLETCSLKR